MRKSSEAFMERMFDVALTPRPVKETAPRSEKVPVAPSHCSCGRAGTPDNPITVGVSGKWFCRACHAFVDAFCRRSYEEAERMCGGN